MASGRRRHGASAPAPAAAARCLAQMRLLPLLLLLPLPAAEIGGSGPKLAGSLAALGAEADNGRSCGSSGGPARLFSGFVNPCRYLQIHRNRMGLNCFVAYPGSETLEQISAAVERYCSLGGPLPAAASVPQPWWRGAYELRRARYRIGVADCYAGLRAPPNMVATQMRADAYIEDFGTLAAHLQVAGVPLYGLFLNLGAADGLWSDPLTQYIRQDGARGLAVEAEPGRCRQYRENFPGIQTLCLRINPTTLSEVAAAMQTRVYDILKVDIDSYDCDVLRDLLGRFGHRPSAILLEFNPAFPPPVEFAVRYHGAWDGLDMSNLPTALENGRLAYGCSLSYIVRLLASFDPGYVLLQVFKKDAMFLRVDVAERLLGNSDLPDEFECYHSSLVETRHVERGRLRHWALSGELPETLAEMRAMARADLVDRLGSAAGSVAPFDLSVPAPQALLGENETSERFLPALFRSMHTQLVSIAEPTTSNTVLAFRDLVDKSAAVRPL